MSMGTTASATATASADEARAEVARVAEQVATWQAKRDTLARELGDKERAAAAAALDGASTARLAGDLARLRAELAIADGALVELGERTRAAEKAVGLAELDDLRRQHAALAAEIADHLARLGEAWAPVEALDGMPLRAYLRRCPGRIAEMEGRLNRLRLAIEWREERLLPPDQWEVNR